MYDSAIVFWQQMCFYMQQTTANGDGLSIVNETNAIKHTTICSILYSFKMGTRAAASPSILLKREKDISYQYFDVPLIDHSLKRTSRALYLIVGLPQQLSSRNNSKWLNDLSMDKHISPTNTEIYILTEQLVSFVKAPGSINLSLDRLIWYVYMTLEI